VQGKIRDFTGLLWNMKRKQKLRSSKNRPKGTRQGVFLDKDGGDSEWIQEEGIITLLENGLGGTDSRKG